MNRALHANTITANLSGKLMIPLVDAENNSIPRLRVGPIYNRNPIRFYARMPSLEEAKRLPAPSGYDRSTVRFTPERLIISAPLPPHCTCAFSRVMCNGEKAKMSKKALHRWTGTDDTGMYPSERIQGIGLMPGQVIELEGVSYWFNNQNYRHTKPPSGFHYPLPPEPPPDVLIQQPATLQILMNLSWLPAQVGKRKIQVIHGDPLDFGAQDAPMSATAETPERKNIRPVPSQPLIVDDED